MAERRCPVCGQALPEALTQIKIDSRLQQLASPALAEERKHLQKEFETRVVAERELARERAEKKLRSIIDDAERRAQRVKQENATQLNKQRAEFDRGIRAEREGARRAAERKFRVE